MPGATTSPARRRSSRAAIHGKSVIVTGAASGLGRAAALQIAREVVRPNPMRRFGTTEELGHLVALLLSGDAAYVNAAVIPLDGGQSAKY